MGQQKKVQFGAAVRESEAYSNLFPPKFTFTELVTFTIPRYYSISWGIAKRVYVVESILPQSLSTVVMLNAPVSSPKL